jgi:hypothetical protein
VFTPAGVFEPFERRGEPVPSALLRDAPEGSTQLLVGIASGFVPGAMALVQDNLVPISSASLCREGLMLHLQARIGSNLPLTNVLAHALTYSTLPTAPTRRSRSRWASPPAPPCDSCAPPPPPRPPRVDPRRATAAPGGTVPPTPVVRPRRRRGRAPRRETGCRAARHAPLRAAAGDRVVPRGRHPRCGSPARQARATSAASPLSSPSDLRLTLGSGLSALWTSQRCVTV